MDCLSGQPGEIVAYQASPQFATAYLNFLNAAKAKGLTYPSQYTITSFDPDPAFMYALQYGNIFGTPLSAKTNAFDVYNAS